MKKIILIAVTVLALFSCKKSNTEDTKNSSKKLYLLSNEYGSSTGKDIIKYFVNGVPATIGDGVTASYWGEDLEVSGNDVYVLASKTVSSTGARSSVVYKNGAEIISIPYSTSFYPNSLAVNGSDIYLSGSGSNPGTFGTRLKLWKNGTITQITNTNYSNAGAWDMVVHNNDVYLAGYEVNDSFAVQLARYWKNGSPVTITNGMSGNAGEIHRILINGSDVYCSGMVDGKPVVWKNGTATPLSTSNATCYGIAVNGNDVYAAGKVDNGTVYKAAYWKNTQQTNLNLANSNSLAQSDVFGVAVDGNDVYVAGGGELANNVYKAVYWKNSVENILPTTTGYTAVCYRMVLK
jgi:hypothetical protein